MRFFISLLVTFALMQPLQAAVVLDQQNNEDPNGGRLNGDASSLIWQQEVIVGISGKLAGFEVLSRIDNSSANLFINQGTPWQSDAPEFFANVTFPSAGWSFVDVSAANIMVNAGDRFAIGIQGTNGGFFFHGTSPANYAGDLYLNTAPFGADMAFRTYVETQVTAPVPEPASFALWGLGCVGCAMGGYRRRFRS